MLVACAVELLLMVFVLLFCSETLELQARKPMDWKRANPVGSLIVLFKAPFVQGVMAILGVVAIALACFNAITYFYISHRYGGGTTEYGIAQALWAASAVFSSGLSAAISRRTSERITLLVGMFLGAVASVGCAMAPTLLVFYVSITCFGLIMMAYPAYLAIISKQVAATRQAEVQSGAYAFALACQGLGVLMMGGIFALTIDASPEMPWMVWAICGLLLLLACFAAIPYLRLHPDDKVRIVDEQVQVYADESNESTSLIGDDVRCR
jgi:DHA1 family tetracycline resistance protein-like MFS transporter